MGTFKDYIETHISAYDADRMHERLSIDFPCEDGRIKAVVAQDKAENVKEL